MLSERSLAAQSIAVGPWGVVREAALIQKYNGFCCLFVRLNRFLKGLPCVCARFGVIQRFFYK
jgi:hypothetical protein